MLRPSLRTKTLQVALFAIVLTVGASATSYAGPLGTTLDQFPVMNAQSITSIFNNGSFTATGTAVGWNDGSGTNAISQAFKLTASFTNGTATSASLTIGSDATPYVFASNLVNFAYSATKGGTIEFLFANVGGSSGIFDSNDPLDVAITVSSTFTPQFTTGWMNSLETATLKQPAVPEPASLLLMLAGAASIYGVRRRRVAVRA